MKALPCRRNLLELLDNVIEQYHKHADGEPSVHNGGSEEVPGEMSGLLPVLVSYSMRERTHLSENAAAHYLSTFLIVGGCYIAAVMAPGVAFVWSLCGSFMAYLISFILPCICYLQIERKLITKEWGWIVFSWTLLLFAIVSAIACTTQTTYLLIFPK
jgi:Transmembrane amino acid transporter protein